MDEEQRKALNQELAGFFGQLEQRLDGRIDALGKAMHSEFDGVNTRLDGIVARLDTDDAERAALSSQVDRHEGWIHQLADSTNTKLAPKQ